ncbi:MAG: DHA2 family efflux MFS transporter permease subunit [Candidatus Binataceae bacterium]
MTPPASSFSPQISQLAERPSGAGKWLVAISVIFGTFLSVMDATVVNVAMPHMMGSFGEDLLTITWVSTAYSIAEIIMITMTAWWAAVLGRKRLFVGSMILFTIGSVLAGTSQSFKQMLFYRVLQGIGGGSLIPSSQAIMRETFPPSEQGMAMAVYGMGVVLAPAIGPVLGGWLIDRFGWRWVFYINVPFSIVGLLMVAAFVTDPPYLKRGVQRVDWTGITFLTVGLSAMQIVLERGQEVDWFASHWIFAGTVIAIVALIALVVWELYGAEEPVIDFRLFGNTALSVGSGIGMVIGFALFGSTFLLPQFTQDLLGYPALQAGIVLLPRAVALLIVMPIIGRLYNYVSPRLLILLGLVALMYGEWRLAHLSLSISIWTFFWPLVTLGIGMACSIVVLSTVSLSTMPRQQMTGASSLYTVTRRVSGNVAYALLATLLARRTQFHRAALADDITRLNPSYSQATAGFAHRLTSFGVAQPAVQMHAVAMLNDALNRQASVMAYNDAYWLMAIMFILSLPLVLLLPRRRSGAPAEGPTH